MKKKVIKNNEIKFSFENARFFKYFDEVKKYSEDNMLEDIVNDMFESTADKSLKYLESLRNFIFEKRKIDIKDFQNGYTSSFDDALNGSRLTIGKIQCIRKKISLSCIVDIHYWFIEKFKSVISGMRDSLTELIKVIKKINNTQFSINEIEDKLAECGFTNYEELLEILNENFNIINEQNKTGESLLNGDAIIDFDEVFYMGIFEYISQYFKMTLEAINDIRDEEIIMNFSQILNNTMDEFMALTIVICEKDCMLFGDTSKIIYYHACDEDYDDVFFETFQEIMFALAIKLTI